MRKTNLMLEVSDDLYESVIEPHKKNKQFTKLIITLLEGYKSNEFISSYVEGTLDELREEASRSYDDAIDAMKRNLSQLDMHIEEAESINSQGKEYFKSKAERNSADNVNKSGGESDFVIERLLAVEKQNQQILEALSSILGSGTEIKMKPQIPSEKPVRFEEVESKEKDLDESITDIDDPLFSPIQFNVKNRDLEIEEEDEISSEDIFNSLIEGQGVDF